MTRENKSSMKKAMYFLINGKFLPSSSAKISGLVSSPVRLGQTGNWFVGWKGWRRDEGCRHGREGLPEEGCSGVIMWSGLPSSGFKVLFFSCSDMVL